jgi:hypothetical protein
VQCCAMQCMCDRASKGSGKQITGKADTLCKQGERGRSPTGKGFPCKAGMRTKGKTPCQGNTLSPTSTKSPPTEMQVSEWAGRLTPSELLSPVATDSGHVCQVRKPYRYPRLCIKGTRYRGLTTNLGARLPIGKPTPVTCLSGGGAQVSTGAKSSEWKHMFDNSRRNGSLSSTERVVEPVHAGGSVRIPDQGNGEWLASRSFGLPRGEFLLSL